MKNTILISAFSGLMLSANAQTYIIIPNVSKVEWIGKKLQVNIMELFK